MKNDTESVGKNPSSSKSVQPRSNPINNQEGRIQKNTYQTKNKFTKHFYQQGLVIKFVTILYVEQVLKFHVLCLYRSFQTFEAFTTSVNKSCYIKRMHLGVVLKFSFSVGKRINCVNHLYSLLTYSIFLPKIDICFCSPQVASNKKTFLLTQKEPQVLVPVRSSKLF